jgi:hypothetical protein
MLPWEDDDDRAQLVATPPHRQVWAIEIDGQRLVSCAGPLDPRDVDQVLLPHLPYTPRDVRHLEGDWASYVPYLLCSACGDVVRPGAATAANGAEGRVHLRCSL